MTLTSIRRRQLCVAALISFVTSGLHAQPDPSQLIKNADLARGGGIPGLTWDVFAVNTGSLADELPDHRLRIKASDASSLAEVLEPANSKGAKMLQVDRNMWMTKPGLRKPVAISPRQRLTGQASIGDIAATNYAKDYTAQLIKEESIGEELCVVLELTANTKQTTYDRITYWISKSRGVALRADFLTPSGKLMKSARFEYSNSASSGGRAFPFISRMVITDALSDAQTTLQYSNIKVQPIAAAEFDVANLQ